MTDDHVRIFDTTLRDGEQAPGFSMTEEGKLKMARALAELRVDVIEAGFAAASPGDARAEVPAAIDRLLATDGPVLCHARIDPRENVWPLVPPNKANIEMMEGKP